jgi:putative spermidine/putrescine transport system substrate-binding protein
MLIAGLAVLAGCGTAYAQDSVTVVSFGGDYQAAERQAMYKPAAEKLGIKIDEDSLKGIADVRLQVQSGNPTWDIVELGRQYCMSAEAAKLFEPLDFSKIPNAKDLDQKLVGKNWIAGPVTYSAVLAWSTAKYGDNPPKAWADFFDVKKFPGNRALYAQPRFMLEAALMGDGVSPDKVYPIDVDRAIAKIGKFKDNIQVFYASHGQSVQMAKDGEVDMMAMLDGRAQAAIKDGAKFSFTYNQGIIDTGCLAIPKGAPHKENAMRVINEFLAPEIQANIPLAFAYGPINPKAYDVGKIPADVAASLNSAPANLKKQLVLDSGWWAENEAKVRPKWDAMLQK